MRSYIRDLEPVVEMGPDALIMSDPGLIMLVRERWPDLEIHLSVQANAVNWATVKFWSKQGIKRIILSRELGLEEIEEILIQSDVGVKATMTLMDNVRDVVKERMIDESADLEAVIKEQIELMLGQDGQSVSIIHDSPHVILVLGVNGAGKTTTIGKLCHRFKSEGKSVLVAAADTFRAAAAEQLQIWCERSDTDLIRSDEGIDPASVVFDALHATQSRQVDVLIIDTAGRLHTKKPLMDELAKIGRVISREIPKAPHEVLLVVDGTAGQNAIIQANVFNEAVPVTGVAVTKLDGTAKGGVVIAIRQEIGVPIKLIGIGEQLDDLRDFVARDFVSALFENDESSI